MKKIFVLIFTVLLIFTLGACSQTEGNGADTSLVVQWREMEARVRDTQAYGGGAGVWVVAADGTEIQFEVLTGFALERSEVVLLYSFGDRANPIVTLTLLGTKEATYLEIDAAAFGTQGMPRDLFGLPMFTNTFWQDAKEDYTHVSLSPNNHWSFMLEAIRGVYDLFSDDELEELLTQDEDGWISFSITGEDVRPHILEVLHRIAVLDIGQIGMHRLVEGWTMQLQDIDLRDAVFTVDRGVLHDIDGLPLSITIEVPGWLDISLRYSFFGGTFPPLERPERVIGYSEVIEQTDGLQAVNEPLGDVVLFDHDVTAIENSTYLKRQRIGTFYGGTFYSHYILFLDGFDIDALSFDFFMQETPGIVMVYEIVLNRNAVEFLESFFQTVQEHMAGSHILYPPMQVSEDGQTAIQQLSILAGGGIVGHWIYILQEMPNSNHVLFLELILFPDDFEDQSILDVLDELGEHLGVDLRSIAAIHFGEMPTAQ